MALISADEARKRSLSTVEKMEAQRTASIAKTAQAAVDAAVQRGLFHAHVLLLADDKSLADPTHPRAEDYEALMAAHGYVVQTSLRVCASHAPWFDPKPLRGKDMEAALAAVNRCLTCTPGSDALPYRLVRWGFPREPPAPEKRPSEADGFDRLMAAVDPSIRANLESKKKRPAPDAAPPAEAVCVVCLDARPSVRLLPCRHIIYCAACSVKCEGKPCAVCNAAVSGQYVLLVVEPKSTISQMPLV